MHFSTLMQQQKWTPFADEMFNFDFLCENFNFEYFFLLKFVPTDHNDKNSALVRVMAWRRTWDQLLSETMMALYTYGTFTHARAEAGGGGRKIGFNTNHYMCSHMRGRGAEAAREQNPLRKKWVQHPIFRVRFETARSKPSLSSTNGRSARVRSAYVWTYPR